jgi:glutamate-5-semialdehyde dehydrogenase
MTSPIDEGGRIGGRDDGPLRLTSLSAGQVIVFGGDRFVVVDEALAAAFQEGDRLVVDPLGGALLHVPAEQHAIAEAAVTRACDAFAALSRCSDDQISDFFEHFAEALEHPEADAEITAANAADVESAAGRGRSTTRLELSPSMLAGMIDGLRGWARSELRRDTPQTAVTHADWRVEARRAPLGVVGFVFEGRPNVFADAVGVLRTGNTVVFRIGSDALGTARAIMQHAVTPSLEAAGLPTGAVSLVASPSHAAGWALFSDSRLSLAVARGSGPAVAQLGAVARQAGVPVSLHGTGGAWMVAAVDADSHRFAASVRHSLDRKVCNTLNVCCIVGERATELVPLFVDAVDLAAAGRGVDARIHVTAAAAPYVPAPARQRTAKVGRADGVQEEPFVSEIDVEQLGHEWEWERSPEVSLHVVDSVAEAVALHNRLSPRFVASLISESPDEHDRFFAAVDAPFVGDGFTRWVDGQYALGTPELGLSNWEAGRMLGRGGILSGDGVHTVRYRAHVADHELHR